MPNGSSCSDAGTRGAPGAWPGAAWRPSDWRQPSVATPSGLRGDFRGASAEGEPSDFLGEARGVDVALGLGLAVGDGRGVGAAGWGAGAGGAGAGGGTGAGLGVGFGDGGAGRGVGPEMTTLGGATVVRVVVFTPPGALPLVAENEYRWSPAGRLIERENVTPPTKSDPDVLSANVPTPWTMTTTRVGVQPALSEYRTEKVTTVDVVPASGAAAPLQRTRSCPFPLQLAAAAGVPETSIAAAIARIEVVRRLMRARGTSVPSPDGTWARSGDWMT
jgi:hypothetical protein